MKGDSAEEKYLLDRLAQGLDQALSPLLEAIEARLEKSEKEWAWGLAEGTPEPFRTIAAQSFNDERECAVGLYLVTHQASITEAVSLATKLSVLRGLPKPKKEALLGSRSRLVDGSSISVVQGIDAGANYFKHRDQWLVETDEGAASVKTKAALRAIGCELESVSLLFELVGILLPGPECSLVDLDREIWQWRSRIHVAYSKGQDDCDAEEVV